MIRFYSSKDTIEQYAYQKIFEKESFALNDTNQKDTLCVQIAKEAGTGCRFLDWLFGINGRVKTAVEKAIKNLNTYSHASVIDSSFRRRQNQDLRRIYQTKFFVPYLEQYGSDYNKIIRNYGGNKKHIISVGPSGKITDLGRVMCSPKKSSRVLYSLLNKIAGQLQQKESQKPVESLADKQNIENRLQQSRRLIFKKEINPYFEISKCSLFIGNNHFPETSGNRNEAIEALMRISYRDKGLAKLLGSDEIFLGVMNLLKGGFNLDNVNLEYQQGTKIIRRPQDSSKVQVEWPKISFQISNKRDSKIIKTYYLNISCDVYRNDGHVDFKELKITSDADLIAENWEGGRRSSLDDPNHTYSCSANSGLAAGILRHTD